MSEAVKLTHKDFASSSDVRWCPGCGDYSILNSVRKVVAEMGYARENLVFVSGIGCSSRFPYYMNTYGFHTLHGRAPAVATGVKVANPELSVWQITGDGDAMSIGTNHLIHLCRKNVDINVMLFNNRIYGLTKGQCSPTSSLGKKTKTTPMGSIDTPVNPLSVVLAAGAGFIGRTADKMPKHMQETLKAAALHKGTSFVEIFQNCNIFNDKIWDVVVDRKIRDDHMIELIDGQPLIFGKEKDKGLVQKGFSMEVVNLSDVDESQLVVHNSKDPDPAYTSFLTQMNYPDFPVPYGIFKEVERPTYEDMMTEQVEQARAQKGNDLQALLKGKDFWEIS